MTVIPDGDMRTERVLVRFVPADLRPLVYEVGPSGPSLIVDRLLVFEGGARRRCWHYVGTPIREGLEPFGAEYGQCSWTCRCRWTARPSGSG